MTRVTGMARSEALFSTLTEPVRALTDIVRNPLLGQLDSFCEGSIIVDAEARIRWISDKYRRLLGLPEDSPVTGRPVESVIPNSMMRQIVTQGKPIPLDLMLNGKQWMVVARFPIRDKNDRILGGIGFVFYKDLDYLKPFTRKFARLADHNTSAERQLSGLRQARYDFSDLVGQSSAMRTLLERARRAAELDTTVLILGETGTGKELLAHAIHQASARANRPFVCVNMAAIPESLMEAEFFGAAPGAYTGADRKGRLGKIQLADTGTLFLDEVGDLPPALQSKLLRVLQEQEVEPLGSNAVQRVDVRIIAATSRDLGAMVEAGNFRPDLYYRLNVLPLQIPALRDRREDLPALARHILESLAAATSLPPKSLHPRALDVLRHYHWPGNVRELQNTLERAFIFSTGDVIRADDLVPLAQTDSDASPSESEHTACAATLAGADRTSGEPADVRPLREVLEEAERAAIASALAATGGNRTAAARLLGISRTTLYEKLDRLGGSPAP